VRAVANVGRSGAGGVPTLVAAEVVTASAFVAVRRNSGVRVSASRARVSALTGHVASRSATVVRDAVDQFAPSTR
jgi:hypothetical protein